MPSHKQTNILPYTPKQIFDIVADIEKYPEFLPWCSAARIIKHDSNNVLYAELVLKFKLFREKYTSKVTLHPSHEIEVEMTKGPFHYLINHWKFLEHPNGVKVEFLVDFSIRSKIIDKAVGKLFTHAINKMSDAFKKRADKLYGDKNIIND